MVRNRDMTGGQLVTFLLYLQSLSDAFSTIGWVFTSLTQAVGAADKVFELLHRKPKRRDPSVAAEPGSIRTTDGILGIVATKTQELRSRGLKPELISGEVVLEDVVFHYPARPKRKILDRLSLRVPSGSTVALVGPSGSGKSSILSLIQHLYEPSSGSVQLDGVDVHELSPSWLSKNVAVVSQEPTLFARSIKENITYGLEDAPPIEEIHEAARLANAHDFIQDMPQG
jgi:ABC-type multidrug transport system fused ATPase/permease subunit